MVDNIYTATHLLLLPLPSKGVPPLSLVGSNNTLLLRFLKQLLLECVAILRRGVSETVLVRAVLVVGAEDVVEPAERGGVVLLRIEVSCN